MSTQSHISEHLLGPNDHVKALATTSEHDCQDLLTPLPHHTTTMFCIHKTFLGARRRNSISGENSGGLALV